jgi:hypothetical protein
LKHIDHIRALEALRAEILARLPIIDEMLTDARTDLVILGPIAQLQHSLNDSLASIGYVSKLLMIDERASKRTKRST